MRPHHEAGSYRRQTKVESRRQSPGRFSRASDVGHEPDRKYSGQVSKRLPPALTETKIWKMRRTEIFPATMVSPSQKLHDSHSSMYAISESSAIYHLLYP